MPELSNVLKVTKPVSGRARILIYKVQLQSHNIQLRSQEHGQFHRSTDLIATPSLRCSWTCEMMERPTDVILVQWLIGNNAYWEDAIGTDSMTYMALFLTQAKYRDLGAKEQKYGQHFSQLEGWILEKF